MTVSDEGYTKHYYTGNERIASRLGGGFINAPIGTGDKLEPFVEGYSYTEFSNILLTAMEEDIACVGLDNRYISYKAPLGIIDDLRNADNTETDLYFYHQDHLGSSTYLTDNNGYPTEHRIHMPFGEDLLYETNTTAYYSPFTFSAKERDMETAYSYFGARYYDPGLSIWLSVDPLADEYPSHSPFNYCMLNPIMLKDPDGRSANPVFDSNGKHLGNTSEGFTGEVLIYSGTEQIDFSNYTVSEAKLLEGVDTYDNQRSSLSNGAKENIWTIIVSKLEGQFIYDKKFSMSTIEGGIQYLDINGSWGVPTNHTGSCRGNIFGSDNYQYETTVENIQSSIVVHEWYSHMQKGNRDLLKSHRLAYKNVINYKALWNLTTESYKGFNMLQLRNYTERETGRTSVDSPYRKLFNRYSNSY